MKKSKKNNKKTTFSEELNIFVSSLNDIPSVDPAKHSLKGWKQLQYSIIDDTFSNLGKLSIRFRELYNSSGPFTELLNNFNELKKELIVIIESEKSSYSDYISDGDISKIRIFINKVSSFIAYAVAKINEYRNIYSEINESSREINNNIFIVHGPEERAVQVVKKLFNKTDYNIVVLEEQATEGMQFVFDKFIETARPCGFAIVVMFANDQNMPIFRPNVLFELGYFLGTLGKRNILIISNCEEDKMPSDIKGVYIHKMSNPNWEKEVKRSLIKRGFVI